MHSQNLSFDLQQRQLLKPLNINDLVKKYPLGNNGMEEFDQQLLQGIDVSRMKYLGTTTDKNKAVIKSQIASKSVDCMLIGGGIGLFTGGIVCGVAGGLVAGGGGALVGTLGGINAGFVVGIAIGAAVGATVGYVQITMDHSYLDWKAKAIQSESYAAYKAYIIREFEDADQFLCPISYDFPGIPVRTPQGHIYDLQSINEHIDAKLAEEKIMHAAFIREHLTDAEKRRRQAEFDSSFCPFRGPRFSKSDLIYDAIYVRTLRAALDKHIQNRFDIPAEVMNGINAFIAALKRNHNMIIAQKIQIACERMDEVGLRHQPARIAMIAELLQ